MCKKILLLGCFYKIYVVELIYLNSHNLFKNHYLIKKARINLNFEISSGMFTNGERN